jgi:hypothetical protein
MAYRGSATHEPAPTLRQKAALRAAHAVAHQHGVAAAEPRVLDDCNNTIVHLAPLPLVAKVCSTTTRPAGPVMLQTELGIALHLVRLGAPVVGPSPLLPQRVHRDREHAITFWRYQGHDPEARVDPRTAGRVLKRCHQALDTYGGSLPSFQTRQVRRAGRVLADATALLALPLPDRAFLTDEYSRLTSELLDRPLSCRPLHGDPHRRNLLVSADACLMIDFESACTGPPEWDLSALPGGGGDQFPSVDHDLLALLRQLRALCVAVWCWAQAGRTPALDNAARSHLALLKSGRLRDRMTGARARSGTADSG